MGRSSSSRATDVAPTAHLRVDAAPSLFAQRVTGDFLVTLRAGDDVELGLLREGATFSWMTRKVGGAWRIETTARREDLPRTVTVSAVAAGARIGVIACRRLSRAEVETVAPSFERMAA